MGRPPLSEKLNMKKGLWTEEEDAKILAYVSKHGTGNWTDVPRRAGLRVILFIHLFSSIWVVLILKDEAN